MGDGFTSSKESGIQVPKSLSTSSFAFYASHRMLRPTKCFDQIAVTDIDIS